MKTTKNTESKEKSEELTASWNTAEKKQQPIWVNFVNP